MLGVIQDITERKLVEEQQFLFRALFEAARKLLATNAKERYLTARQAEILLLERVRSLLFFPGGLASIETDASLGVFIATLPMSVAGRSFVVLS